MSVAQVKKRFGEMESYLGRDKEALRRLKLLKDDVNVLRTSLAAAEEKAEQAEVVKNAARERADKAELNAEILHQENERLQSIIATLNSRLSAAERPDNPERNSEIKRADTEAEVKAMMKELRKLKPECPHMDSWTPRRFPKTMVYNREDIAQGWSRKQIWALGATVAILAAMDGTIVIRSDERLRDIKTKTESSAWSRHMLEWFDPNISREDDWSELDRARMAARPQEVKPHHFMG